MSSHNLGHTELVRFSGYSTEWDFVERHRRSWSTGAGTPTCCVASPGTTRPGPPSRRPGRPTSGRSATSASPWRCSGRCPSGCWTWRSTDRAVKKDLDAITRGDERDRRVPIPRRHVLPGIVWAPVPGTTPATTATSGQKVFGDDMFSRFEAEGCSVLGRCGLPRTNQGPREPGGFPCDPDQRSCCRIQANLSEPRPPTQLGAFPRAACSASLR